MELLFKSRWRLHAQGIAQAEAEEDGFHLPGALELSAFADLIGGDDGEAPGAGKETPDEDNGIPFPLPAALPEDAKGEAVLSLSIDFSSLSGEHCMLLLPMLSGSGEILLGGQHLAGFCDQSMALDLTDALLLGRRQRLDIRFDDRRPAGISGVPLLRVSRYARIAGVSIEPDTVSRTVRVTTALHADTPGDYALRLAALPGDEKQPFREATLPLRADETGSLSLCAPLRLPRFLPGTPYAVGTVKLELWRRDKASPTRPGTLCDTRAMLCGYPGAAPEAYIPLTRADCAMPTETLISRLLSLHVPAVSMPFAPTEALLAVLTRAGIAALLPYSLPENEKKRLSRFPCVCFADVQPLPPRSPLADAWMLCGMTGMNRTPDAHSADHELLREAVGRRVDESAPGNAEILDWLRVVRIRLCAEAAAQHRLSGAICREGEWLHGEAAEAIAAALAPTHLSALPLCGAWWTLTRFSASLRLCGNMPEGSPFAQCLLEDEEGRVLARYIAPVSPGGDAGVFSAMLPDHPCALTLLVQLTRGSEVLEEYTLPVYVGERGPLEAVFA